jgi:hypothetical protein
MGVQELRPDLFADMAGQFMRRLPVGAQARMKTVARHRRAIERQLHRSVRDIAAAQ